MVMQRNVIRFGSPHFFQPYAQDVVLDRSPPKKESRRPLANLGSLHVHPIQRIDTRHRKASMYIVECELLLYPPPHILDVEDSLGESAKSVLRTSRATYESDG